ncbi:MAG: response regulator [Candidatus Hydrothermarchaeaceae archaeon]
MAKILLVDDEPEIAHLTGLMLGKVGYEMVAAEDSVECFERLKEGTPDLILMDIMMPGDDGWVTCKKIKEDEKTKDIPVAMFTVRTSDDSVKKSFEYAHADAHINKPFHMEEFLNTVKGLLEKAVPS